MTEKEKKYENQSMKYKTELNNEINTLHNIKTEHRKEEKETNA